MKLSFGTESINLYKSVPAIATQTKSTQSNSFTKKDVLSIGQQAHNLYNGHQQKTSMIESLMKQRESIQEMKSNLTESTLESGGNLSAIKEQLKELDKQIMDIDAQISKQQNDAIKQKDNFEDKEKPSNTMDSILQISTSLEKAKNLSRAKNGLDREQNTLKNEVKSDASRGVFIDSKYDKLSDLESRIETLREGFAKEIQTNKQSLKTDAIEENQEEVKNKLFSKEPFHSLERF